MSRVDLRSRFVDLGEDLRVLEHVVFLQSKTGSETREGRGRERCISHKLSSGAKAPHNRTKEEERHETLSLSLSSRLYGRLTSSPTLILLPPHPGNNTLSPSFTETGTTSPVLDEGAPGPTAMTVASGMVVVVEEEGMKRPEAVFYGA